MVYGIMQTRLSRTPHPTPRMGLSPPSSPRLGCHIPTSSVHLPSPGCRSQLVSDADKNSAMNIWGVFFPTITGWISRKDPSPCTLMLASQKAGARRKMNFLVVHLLKAPFNQIIPGQFKTFLEPSS